MNCQESQEKQCQAESNCTKVSVGRERWMAALMMATGAAFGATVMYFCDPHRGKARRAELRQKAARTARQGGQTLTKHAMDMLNRAKGTLAKANATLGPCEENVDDAVTGERVRSRLGHVTLHAGAIQTEVASGVVTLRGTIARDKRRHLVDEILVVPGVTGVRDHLVSESSM